MPKDGINNDQADGQPLKPPASGARDTALSLLNAGSKLFVGAVPSWASATIGVRTPISCVLEDNNILTPSTQKGSTAKKVEQPNSNNKERVVTPAYAYKNPKTNLLEIKEVHPPTPSKLASVNSFIYPIAKNGGNIYSDSRDYYDKTGKMSLFAPTIEDDEHRVDATDVNKENKSGNMDQSNSKRDGAKSPWKEWEKVQDTYDKRIETIEILKSEKRKQATVSFVDDGVIGGYHNTSSSYACYNEEDFDFALVLKPNPEYSFWADRLDFRPEGGMMDDSLLLNKHRPEGGNVGENKLNNSRYASTKAADKQPNISPVRRLFSVKKSAPNSVFDRAMDALTPPRSNSLLRRTSAKRNLQKFGSSPSLKALRGEADRNDEAGIDQMPNSTSRKKGTPSSIQRRRWGNPTLNRELSKSDLRRLDLTSPSVVSCKKNAGDPCTRTASLSKKRKTPNNADAQLDFEFLENIPPQKAPRGITKRLHGQLSKFLDALKIGIVVRRHKPNAVAQYVKLFTDDGGDTIQFQHILPEEATLALKEQAVRYKNFKRLKLVNDVAGQPEATAITRQTGTSGFNKIALPDYLAAQHFREEQSRAGGISKALHNLKTKMSYSGSIHASEIMEVHPARKKDPFAKDTDFEAAEPKFNGTVSVRASRSFYSEFNTFSLVLLPSRIRHTDSSKDKCVEQWCHGEGSPQNFRYIDFETETEVEYWLLLGGFVSLQREASTGRFARQRAMGVSSHVNKREAQIQLQNQRREEQSKQEEIQANSGSTLSAALTKVTRFLGLEGNSREREFDRFAESKLPPPSDYFLGFGSSGTQIWSRLRQAGLETQRIYALDKKGVMIRVRCPKDRLHDVAEVLRLKLKTKDGSYEAFREEAISMFERSSDSRKDSSFFVLRSSDRQKIIDFIINSRIRDSGAELGEHTKLGKEIQMRVPLHMHSTLDRLYGAWVTFWFEENWKGRDGRSMSVVPTGENSSNCNQTAHGRPISPSSVASTIVSDGRSNPAHVKKYELAPNAITRFVLGSFFQPLDSIQQYFGDGVAFYFAWQQHCAIHLVFLSVIGLIVSAVLIFDKRGGWDHPIRPFFSFFIMIWSFFVMVTWRQRQTYLAHRWGTLNYQEEETTRPQFHGNYEQDPITKEWTIHYPSWKRWLKYIISVSVVSLLTVGTLYVVMVLFSNRDNFLCTYEKNRTMKVTIKFDLLDLLKNSTCDVMSSNSTLIGIDNSTKVSNLTDDSSSPFGFDFRYWLINFQFPAVMALGLPLLNFVLMRLAVALTEFENYRTESEYRNQLIIKVFAFRFVCYFASLYWYSFNKVPVSLKSAADIKAMIKETIGTVAFMLMISLTVSHWWTLLLTIFIPQWFHRWRLYEHQKKVINEIRLIEEIQDHHESQDAVIAVVEARDIKLVNYRILLQQAQSNVWLETMLPEHISFHDYVYVVIQFAFVTCFSVMLPIAPLISLLNHLWGMRLDAYKLCKGRRRPIVQRAGGIGVWEHVLHIVTVIGVVTNCALTAFTNEWFQQMRRLDKNEDRILLLVIVVVAWEHLMLLFKYMMQAFFNPMPKSVLFSLKKDKYERDMRSSYNAREKKDRRSRNSIRSTSVASFGNSSAQKPSVRLSEALNLERKEKVPIEQETLSCLGDRQQPSLRITSRSPPHIGEKGRGNDSLSNLPVQERERLLPNTGLIPKKDMALPAVDSDSINSTNLEKENEGEDSILFIEKKPQGNVSGIATPHRTPLKSVLSKTNCANRVSTLKKRGLSPKRSPLRGSTPLFLVSLQSSPKNALRRRAVSTSMCANYGKVNSAEGGDAGQTNDDAFSSHESDYLPTPRRLQLEGIMKSSNSSTTKVNEIRNFFERKSS